MKKTALEFLRRGMAACGFGPLVLAGLYLILQRRSVIGTLSVSEVCLGIVSLSALAFIAGGMNVIYQVDRLPLTAAILIHGSVLYASYLITYLVNGWLEWGAAPILIFSAIFVFGYLLIWAVIYSANRRNTARLNKLLLDKQRSNDPR